MCAGRTSHWDQVSVTVSRLWEVHSRDREISGALAKWTALGPTAPMHHSLAAAILATRCSTSMAPSPDSHGTTAPLWTARTGWASGATENHSLALLRTLCE